MIFDSIKNITGLGKPLALLNAYQKKMNHQDISFYKITNEINHRTDSLDAYFLNEFKKEITIHSKLAEENYNKFKKGDTISLLYPLENNKYNKTVIFYTHYDKKNFIDTLFLKCVLIKKVWKK